MQLYLIGSLRNPKVPVIANRLRDKTRFDVFDDWYSAGPEADDYWQKYENARGHKFAEALAGEAARNVFAFDKRNLQRADMVVLVLPAGKSGHLELGWCLGRGVPGYVLLEGEPDRYDVMYQFATAVFTDIEDLIKELNGRSYATPF
jgi:hypothetical protein